MVMDLVRSLPCLRNRDKLVSNLVFDWHPCSVLTPLQRLDTDVAPRDGAARIRLDTDTARCTAAIESAL